MTNRFLIALVTLTTGALSGVGLAFAISDEPGPAGAAAEIRRVPGTPTSAQIEAELGPRTPELHSAFWEANRGAIEAAKQRLAEGAELTSEQRHLLDRLDALSAQKDSAWSGLYWETDLDQAFERAEAEGKLVLTLRMLGRLDEGLSCANSRFFRAVLYANDTVADVLNDHYVLHWSSERPVPKVTIDYGDGRTVRTTITGNSLHTVLSPRGDILHGMPGLYKPSDFVERLVRIPAIWEREQADPTSGSTWDERVTGRSTGARPADADRRSRSAVDAGVLARGKGPAELPLMDAMGVWEATPPDRFTEAFYLDPDSRFAGGDAALARLLPRLESYVQSGRPNAQFDEAEARLEAIRRELGADALSLMRAQNRALNDTMFNQLLLKFWFSVEQEELGNRRELERQIEGIRRGGNPYRFGLSPDVHPDLLDPQEVFKQRVLPAEHRGHRVFEPGREGSPKLTAEKALDVFYDRVYDTVFLTPRSDRWLGLRRTTIYDGLWHTED